MKITIEGAPIHEAFLISQYPSHEDKTGVSLVWLSLFIGLTFENADAKAEALEYIIERKGKHQTISLYVCDLLVRQYDSRIGKIVFFFEEVDFKPRDMEKMYDCLKGAAYICSASPKALSFPVTRTK